MGSFAAELHVEGYVLPVRYCFFGAAQGTDGRGRVNAKVRHSLVELRLDVPDHDGLLVWAADPAKRLAVDIVFRADAGGAALETLHLAAAYCVGYREEFAASDTGGGAYECRLTLSDPAGWTLTPGGPGPLRQAFQRNPFIIAPPPLPPEIAVVVEESAWARLGAGLLRVLEAGASFPAMLAALLLMPQTANAPGLPSPVYPPATPKDRLELEELERLRETRALTQDEKMKYLLLLARVRGVHLGEDPAGSLAEALEQAKRRTHPSRLVNAMAKPRGRVTAINPKDELDN